MTGMVVSRTPFGCKPLGRIRADEGDVLAIQKSTFEGVFEKKLGPDREAKSMNGYLQRSTAKFIHRQ